MDTKVPVRGCGRDVSVSHQEGRVGTGEKAVDQIEAQRPKITKAITSVNLFLITKHPKAIVNLFFPSVQ